MLDKYTYGNTPAAIFLAERLNTLGNQVMIRKVSSFLDQKNRVLNEVVEAHLAGYLSTRALSALVNLMRREVADSKKQVGDELAQNLMHNVMVGKIKSVLRRTQTSILLDHQANRDLDRFKRSVFPTDLDPELQKQLRRFRVVTPIDADDTITPVTLRERSKQKLARKNKTCTLY